MDYDELDPLLDEITFYVVSNKFASINNVMKKFRTGYNRTYRIFEQMQELGIISPPDIKGVSTVLVSTAKKPSVIENVLNDKPNNEIKGNVEKNIIEFIFYFVIFILIALFFKSCSSGEKQTNDYCSDSISAYVHSKDLIAKSLKSPSTAKFSSYSDTSVISNGECNFAIDGYVDAQNSFGAVIRTRFNATIRFDEKSQTYYLDKLKI
ncbi:putative cell division protein [Yersinia frederiksenii]|nr:putative cell division protein [Yersinia frederiksenii]